MHNLQIPGTHTFIAFSAVTFAFFNRSLLSDVVLCLMGSGDAHCVHIINRLLDYFTTCSEIVNKVSSKGFISTKH